MAQTMVLGKRNAAADGVRFTPAQTALLAILAALGSCSLVLAVAHGSSRDFAIFYGMAVILLSGFTAFRQTSQPTAGVRLPRWFVWHNAMSVPLAMLLFALVQPLFR